MGNIRRVNIEKGELLSWLINLRQFGQGSVISGQYGLTDTQKTYTSCGHLPALLEWTLWQKDESTWDFWPVAEARRASLKEYWDAGGLVSIHMPIPNPKNKSNQHDKDMTDDEFASVQIDGTPLNRNYRDWLDRMASHLVWLQKRGVITLIRPLHEANGKWFWYGQRQPEAFIQLFRYTIDYLKQHHHLHNLIVVFSTNIGPNLDLYYPGKDYVDIIGIDSYQAHPFSLRKEVFTLKRFEKPVMISEAGWSPDNKTPKYSRDAYADIALTIKRELPGIIGWSSWQKNNSPANQLNCRKLYDDPLIIDRDEVNWRTQP